MNRQRIRVGVLRGGPSDEYSVSLDTGRYVLRQLEKREDVFEPVDIFISKDGSWHYKGFQVRPEDIVLYIDVAFVALHGLFGEDGKVQRILERFAVPYTGSSALSSAIGMQKHMSKNFFESEGIRTPLHIILDPQTDDIAGAVEKIAQEFPLPMLVKPADNGSSIGVSLVSSVEGLKDAVDYALEHSDKVLVEEFISGKEATVGVLENFREEQLYTTLPLQVIPTESIFNYNDKYSGITKNLYSGKFSDSESRGLQELAKRAHKALGLKHFSRADFILADDSIYILEINSIPGLTETSPYPQALGELGIKDEDFVQHLISLALKRV